MTEIIIVLLLIVLGIYVYLYYQLKKKLKDMEHKKEIADVAITAMKEIEDIDEAANLSSLDSSKEALQTFSPIAPFAAYYKKRPIQTIPERKVYEALLNIAEDYHVNILPQVPYPCLVSSNSTPSFETINFLRIAKKRVDFAVTDKRGITQFIIEIDGSSHDNDKEYDTIQQKKDVDRDLFFKYLKIPTLRIPLKEVLKNPNEKPLYVMYSKVENHVKHNQTIMNLLQQCKTRQEQFLAEQKNKWN